MNKFAGVLKDIVAVGLLGFMISAPSWAQSSSRNSAA
jgi:hypothetical protein